MTYSRVMIDEKGLCICCGEPVPDGILEDDGATLTEEFLQHLLSGDLQGDRLQWAMRHVALRRATDGKTTVYSPAIARAIHAGLLSSPSSVDDASCWIPALWEIATGKITDPDEIREACAMIANSLEADARRRGLHLSPPGS